MRYLPLQLGVRLLRRASIPVAEIFAFLARPSAADMAHRFSCRFPRERVASDMDMLPNGHGG
jgi:hypothetical protein